MSLFIALATLHRFKPSTSLARKKKPFFLIFVCYKQIKSIQISVKKIFRDINASVQNRDSPLKTLNAKARGFTTSQLLDSKRFLSPNTPLPRRSP